jgi:hypothetical protein
VVHFTALSVSDTAAVNGVTTNELRIVKDLEGEGRDLMPIPVAEWSKGLKRGSAAARQQEEEKNKTKKKKVVI